MTVLAIISAVVGIVGLLITLITIIVKLNVSITKLVCAVDSLKEYTDTNTKCHERYSEQLQDHETRITVIERTSKGAD